MQSLENLCISSIHPELTFSRLSVWTARSALPPCAGWLTGQFSVLFLTTTSVLTLLLSPVRARLSTALPWLSIWRLWTDQEGGGCLYPSPMEV